MLAKKAKTKLEKHLYGNKNKFANTILNEIATAATSRGYKGPFKITAINIDPSLYTEENESEPEMDAWEKEERDFEQNNYKEWLMKTYREDPGSLSPVQQTEAKELIEETEKSSNDSIEKNKEFNNKINALRDEVPPGNALHPNSVIEKNSPFNDSEFTILDSDEIHNFLDIELYGGNESYEHDGDRYMKYLAFLSNFMDEWGIVYESHDKHKDSEAYYLAKEKAANEGKKYIILENMS
jgi:hypothetical protein